MTGYFTSVYEVLSLSLSPLTHFLFSVFDLRSSLGCLDAAF